MHALHYLDEIRPIEEIADIINAQKVSIDNKEELALGRLLIQNLSSKHLDMSKCSDSYAHELRNLIDSKVRGKNNLNVTMI